MNKLIFLYCFIPFIVWGQEQKINDNVPVPGHPRILWLPEEETVVHQKIESDPIAKQLHQAILNECGQIIPLPLLERNQQGRRILHTSREAIRRIFYLSYAYRIEKSRQYLERAEKELLAMAALEDWNPSHFLDVAEMTVAMAIGYDWLYSDLPAFTKEKVKKAIYEKGLVPSMNSSYNGWLKTTTNWNQVCNGGITFGALAVYEDHPDECKQLIERAIASIRIPMVAYQYNGAYPEGYHYWIYGTTYNSLFIDLLETVWKEDFGLCEMPGFLKTGTFMQHMEGIARTVSPMSLGKSSEKVTASEKRTVQCFNFADNGSSTVVNPVMYWFAGKTSEQNLLWREREKLQLALDRNDPSLVRDRLLPMLLVWSKDISFQDIKVPVEKMYSGQGKSALAIMRTGWEDENGIWLGFKGGTPNESHAHMDIGSFVFEAEGVRWAMDFGAQDYHSLESKGIDLWNMTQESPRWNVFRYNNLAHNTLTINNRYQLLSGNASIENVKQTDGQMSATMDLTSVYQNEVSSVKRGIGIIEGKYILVEDEIWANDNPAKIRWNMLTPAQSTIIDKNTISLECEGKKLLIRAESNVHIQSHTWSTQSPNSYDAPNDGTVFVGFEFEVPAHTREVIRVSLIPGGKNMNLSKIKLL